MMKKLIFTMALALLACGAQAQTSKGNISFTGSLGYSQSKGEYDKENKNTSFTSEGYEYTLSPAIGIFMKDNLEIGTSVSLNKYKSNSLTPGNFTLHDFEIEGRNTDYRVYLRQYKFLTEKLAANVTFSVGLSSREFSYVSTQTNMHTYYQSYKRDDSYTTFSTSLSPGLTFFASDNIGITTSMGALTYSYRKAEEKGASANIRLQPYYFDYSYKENVIELDFSSMHLNIGLIYFLGR